jgi:hypothetical protein
LNFWSKQNVFTICGQLIYFVFVTIHFDDIPRFSLCFDIDTDIEDIVLEELVNKESFED